MLKMMPVGTRERLGRGIDASMARAFHRWDEAGRTTELRDEFLEAVEEVLASTDILRQIEHGESCELSPADVVALQEADHMGRMGMPDGLIGEENWPNRPRKA